MRRSLISASKTHVYICSAGHSGSTLLDMLLGSHPSCESLGELSLLPMDIAMGTHCGCGSHFHDCRLWSPILSEYAREHGNDVWNDPYSLNLGYMAGVNVDRRKINALYKLRWKPVLALKYAQQRFGVPLLLPLVGVYDEGIRNILDLYDRVLRHTGKSVTIDSTKRYSNAAAIHQVRPANTRLILLVRDGRGVFYSGLKRGFSKSYSLKAWFNYYNRSMPLFKGRVPPGHVHTVKYEDLVRDPAGTLAGICEFLKIDFDAHMLDFRSVVHHNVNGNKMKIGSASELRLDDAWTRELSGADYDYFLRVAGKLNKALGYE